MAVIKLSKEEQLEFIKGKPLEEVRKLYRPLAESVAKKYVDSLAGVALDQLERARRMFLEKKRDFKFDTYVTYFFKQAIEDFLKGRS